MPRFLKRGMDASAIKAADQKVRETVEAILAQVEDKKDAAIRALSKQFNNWGAEGFSPDATEIEKATSQVASATSRTSSSPRRRSAISRRSSATP